MCENSPDIYVGVTKGKMFFCPVGTIEINVLLNEATKYDLSRPAILPNGRDGGTEILLL